MGICWDTVLHTFLCFFPTVFLGRIVWNSRAMWDGLKPANCFWVTLQYSNRAGTPSVYWCQHAMDKDTYYPATRKMSDVYIWLDLLGVSIIWFIFHFIYGMSSTNHWRNHIFQRGRYTTNQYVYITNISLENHPCMMAKSTISMIIFNSKL